MISMWHAKVFSGLAVLGLGIAVIFFSRQLPYHSDYGPGPGFLPTWIGYVLAACIEGEKRKVIIF